MLEVLREPGATSADRAEPTGSPAVRCPSCSEALDGRLGLKMLEATGDAIGERFPVPVVYCRRCGRAVGLLGQ